MIRKILIIIAALVIFITISACGNDELAYYEYDVETQYIESYNNGKYIPQTEIIDLPKNELYNLPEEFSSHPQDIYYFFKVTDDYIVAKFIASLNPQTIFYTMEFGKVWTYHAANFDSEGNLVENGMFQKFIFENEEYAANFADIDDVFTAFGYVVYRNMDEDTFMFYDKMSINQWKRNMTREFGGYKHASVPIILADIYNPLDRTAKNPNRGLLNGYGNCGIAELQYEARYLFEQGMLPDFIFEHEEIVSLLLALEEPDDIELLSEVIRLAWDLSVATAVMEDLIMRNLEIPETEDLRIEYVDMRRYVYGLGADHIVDINLESVGAGTNAIIIELKDTGWSLLSIFIGIAYNETEGLHYFLSERSHNFFGSDVDSYMFCGRFSDGTRTSYFPIDGNREAFIEAIRIQMLG